MLRRNLEEHSSSLSITTLSNLTVSHSLAIEVNVADCISRRLVIDLWRVFTHSTSIQSCGLSEIRLEVSNDHLHDRLWFRLFGIIRRLGEVVGTENFLPILSSHEPFRYRGLLAGR